MWRSFVRSWGYGGQKNLSSSFTVISVTLTLLGMFECLKYDIRRELSVQIAIAVSFCLCDIPYCRLRSFHPSLSLSASLFLVFVLGISTPLHRFPAKQQLFYLITLLLLLLFVIRVLWHLRTLPVRSCPLFCMQNELVACIRNPADMENIFSLPL